MVFDHQGKKAVDNILAEQNMNMAIVIRPAEENDVPAMLSLVQELALYEKAPHEVTNTIEMMKVDGFGTHPIFNAYVAEADNLIVGIAIFYIAYSTWKGRYIYLDDLVVSENFRRYGTGKKLFDAVGSFAKKNGVNQLRWHVLNWNHPAINFYKKYAASLDSEWITCKLTKDQIYNLF